jgi:two-component system alkaline phosphatase synthesis response regulator PhoP
MGISYQMSSGARILVVDDDREIVRLLKTYLEQNGYSALTAYNGQVGLQLMRAEQPALVILDLMLPDQDGYDITRQARADSKLKSIPIIMLTARVEDTDKIIGLELGADDYITKPFNPREVVARVRSVLRRAAETRPPEKIISSGALLLNAVQHQITLHGQPVDLTPTEFKLLHSLMENPGYAFTRSELVQKLFGYDHESLERTIDSHVKNIRRKIEADPADPTYIQTVYGIGYRFNGE